MDFNGALPSQLPFNLEAEQSVLGAVLLEPSCIVRVMEHLVPESFYREQHGKIYEIMVRMSSSMQVMDFITVLDEVRKEAVFDTPESARLYLTQLAQTVPSVSNVEAYAHIVQEKYRIRSLINTARDIIEASADTDINFPTLIESAEQKIYSLSRDAGKKGLVRIDEIILGTYDYLQKLAGEDKSGLVGISSGFSELDNAISGLNRSDLILVAGRPGMGKTTFAMNIATKVALRAEKDVAIFSLEMSKEQLVLRMLSAEASVNSKLLRSGDIVKPEDWTKLALAAGRMYKCPMYFDDTSFTVPEIKSKLRKLRNIGLVVIDYLQLMSMGRKSDNRVQEISEITRALKLLAKELDVPMMVVSQLSRGPDSRSDHRPVLSDLRDSGSIEQDADIVMFLYREHYYDKESENPNVAECIIAKNRHGDTSTVQLGWNGEYVRFSTLEYTRYE